MERAELLDHVRRLGREFARRGMVGHLRKLRLYWLALSRGLAGARHEVDLKWTEQLVVDWLRTLQVAPFAADYPVRPRGSPCTRCGEGSGQQSTVFTAANYPGGSKMGCHACGAVWLEPDGGAAGGAGR